MTIEQVHIDQIIKLFSELKSKQDLVKLLSDAKNMLYGEECEPIQLKHLTYYANPKLSQIRYRTFSVNKKSGGERIINAPVKGLKAILCPLNFVFQCLYNPHISATGFVVGKSIVDNGKKHIGQNYVLNIDLKDFFHSFDLDRVKVGLLHELWGIDNIGKYKKKFEDDFNEKEKIAFLLACLCTHPFEIDGKIKTVLPQGSPTSPTLTNILCKPLDRKLQGLANRFGATYTRYADDITFSSPHNIYKREENPILNEKGAYDDFMSELERIIKKEKLTINHKKTRLQKRAYRQEVTGLKVNEKVNVQRRYIEQIRMWLYYWGKDGYEKAQQNFIQYYIVDKGHIKNKNAHLINVLDGKLEYLKMVKGDKDSTYKKLKDRFDELSNPISLILDIWENEGIEKAMTMYYENPDFDNNCKVQQKVIIK
ncbi:MAG TPA: reverse transcriptase domain-containing protein [Bacteroidales bacterium]|nr:reverse transcriptase domain-containing protein [Bacteroidales bacterium]HQB20769.1 reverse transcriptase domain-containing protein [Bacteroidales bacterium]